jgi:3-dehydroquinate dehydratase/shikimate dehydrogenase
MLVLVINLNNYKFFINQLDKIVSYIDAIELRLDLGNTLDLKKIHTILKYINIPMIFTLRSKDQGGGYLGSEKNRILHIIELASLKPQYFDLEYDISEDVISFFSCNYPDIKLIGSYHNFTHTPNNLQTILNLLQSKKFDLFKIATYANSTLDTLRMLTFIQDNNKHNNLIGLCMGELGIPTRVLGKIIGNSMSYTVLDKKYRSAPGQITLNALISKYNYQNLNKNTKIYALLGDPVSHSIGDIFHNYAFLHLKKNAVYIKLQLNRNEMETSLKYFKRLPFSGFSITMPLKELAYNLVDDNESEAFNIKAINSIVVKDKYYGFNTDGKGAIAALTETINLDNKRILILGAGGAAKAIISELSKLNVNLTVVNRTVEKAQEIVQEFNGKADDLFKLPELIMQEQYDIVINTLPRLVCSDTMKFFFNDKGSTFLFLDINYCIYNRNYLLDKNSNNNYSFGFHMYLYQAIIQLSNWFSIPINSLKSLKPRFCQHLLKNDTDFFMY